MSSFWLKILAVISMIIDHVGAVLFPQIMVLRLIGRLAFPIFCFLIVEGFYHTSDYQKYLRRMLSFAFISEVPFDIAFYGSFPYNYHQNIFFTLSAGLVVIYFFDKYRKEKPLLGLLALIVGLLAADFLHFDYGSMGVALLFAFYCLRSAEGIARKILFIAFIVILNFGGPQTYAILALIPVYFYNGKRGIKLKYAFYLIYPIHLAILAGIKYAQSMGTF